jgi:hypothetical protein
MFGGSTTIQIMRYRDLVILIALVAVSSWAYEATSVDIDPTPLKTPRPYFRDSSEKAPSPNPPQTYFRDSEEDFREQIPSADLSITANSRLRITLSYPENEEWEPLGLAWVEFEDKSYEVRELSKIDQKTWEFELNEEARLALNSATQPLVKVRLNVLDAEYKVSRSMRSFEVETSKVRWAAR